MELSVAAVALEPLENGLSETVINTTNDATVDFSHLVGVDLVDVVGEV